MNLAFYLDLDSPNDVANLPDSVVVSPRLEMVRRRERELKKDQRVDSAVCLEEPAGDRAEVQVHEGQERRHSLKDERLESAGFEGSVGDQVQHQQHHRLKHTSSEGVSLGGVIRDQAQHQPHQVSKDRKLESEAFNRAEDQAQLLQQQHVLKDKRLKSALLDEAIEVQLRSRSQSQNIRQQQHVLKANMDQTTKIWFPSIPGRERVVTFNLKGWKPDTKIMVFGEKFHVHSVVLLLHSAFFRGLLDAMDAESGISTANTVQYNLDSGEWVPPKRGRDVVWTLQKAVEVRSCAFLKIGILTR